MKKAPTMRPTRTRSLMAHMPFCRLARTSRLLFTPIIIRARSAWKTATAKKTRYTPSWPQSSSVCRMGSDGGERGWKWKARARKGERPRTGGTRTAFFIAVFAVDVARVLAHLRASEGRPGG